MRRGSAGVVLVFLLGAALMTILILRAERLRAAMTLDEHGLPSCDSGLSAAKSIRITVPQQLNSFRPLGATPEGMVWVPGGVFWMSSDVPSFVDARPWHRVSLATNEEFARFVLATIRYSVRENAASRGFSTKRLGVDFRLVSALLLRSEPARRYSAEPQGTNGQFRPQRTKRCPESPAWRPISGPISIVRATRPGGGTRRTRHRHESSWLTLPT